MPTFIEDLERIEKDSLAIQKKHVKPKFEKGIESAITVCHDANKAFSGSWLGYHSCVYYENLESPPVGAQFSPEWGLKEAYGHGTLGDWCEYRADKLYDLLQRQIKSPSFAELGDTANEIIKSCRELREELLSILDACLAKQDDAYLTKLRSQAENAAPRTPEKCLQTYIPKGSLVSRDSLATSQGLRTPPHFELLSKTEAIKSSMRVPEELARIAKYAAMHLSKKQMAGGNSQEQGTNVFIGHGGAPAWRELKDFLEHRLNLTVDEFNMKPTAGMTNVTRLSQMLNDAAFAFLVLTGEDEQVDGTKHARQNVIHEAGLFQGRLGFERAIVLLEEGCEEFSNIEGLGQIRFPPHKIKAVFEEVRQVLERESLLETTATSKR